MRRFLFRMALLSVAMLLVAVFVFGMSFGDPTTWLFSAGGGLVIATIIFASEDPA